MSRAKAKVNLKWAEDDYIQNATDLFREHDIKEVRAEYTRLRDIAQKQVKRMAKSEWTWTDVYKQHEDGFPKLSDIKTKGQLAAALADVSMFVGAKTSSISGLKEQRKEAIKSLHKHGYDFVNEKNYKDFHMFMENYTSKEKAKIYDSKRVAAVFGFATKNKIDAEKLKQDFQYFYEHSKELEKMDLNFDGKPKTAKQVRRMIEKKKK